MSRLTSQSLDALSEVASLSCSASLHKIFTLFHSQYHHFSFHFGFSLKKALPYHVVGPMPYPMTFKGVPAPWKNTLDYAMLETV